LDPLRVEDVGLGPGAATRELPGFDQLDLEPLRFKELEQRDPVDAGGLQGDRLDAALFQPGDDFVKIGGVGAEPADRVGVAVGRDADHMHVGMYINSSRVRVDDFQWRRRGGHGDTERPLRLLPGLGWLPDLGWLLRLFVWNDHGMSPVFSWRMRKVKNNQAPRAKRGIGDV